MDNFQSVLQQYGVSIETVSITNKYHKGVGINGIHKYMYSRKCIIILPLRMRVHETLRLRYYCFPFNKVFRGKV